MITCAKFEYSHYLFAKKNYIYIYIYIYIDIIGRNYISITCGNQKGQHYFGTINLRNLTPVRPNEAPKEVVIAVVLLDTYWT